MNKFEKRTNKVLLLMLLVPEGEGGAYISRGRSIEQWLLLKETQCVKTSLNRFKRGTVLHLTTAKTLISKTKNQRAH